MEPMPTEIKNVYVSSPQNPKIKHALKLRDKRYRRQHGETLIEGFRELRRATDNSYFPSTIIYCTSLFLGENEDRLLADGKDAGALLIETSKEIFRKISYRDRPDGLLAIAPQVQRTLSQLQLTSAVPLLLIAESVEKPGNLGSMLRSADGAGIDAVIVCDRKTDINNPNVVRASVGTLFSIPVVEATTEDTIAFLKAQEIQAIVASPASDKVFWDVDYRQPSAIVVGSEQFGLSELWLENADQRIQIPMHGNADSLNVATASTILLYEAVRQRLPDPKISGHSDSYS